MFPDFLNLRTACKSLRVATTSVAARRDLCRWCLKYCPVPGDTLQLCSWCGHMSRSGAPDAAMAYRMYAFHDMSRVLQDPQRSFVVKKGAGPFWDGFVCEASIPLLRQAGVRIEEQVSSRASPLDPSELGQDPVAFHGARQRSRAFLTAADAHSVYPLMHCEYYDYMCAPWLLAIFGLVVDPWNIQRYPEVDPLFKEKGCFKLLDRAIDSESFTKRMLHDYQEETGRALVLNYEPRDQCEAIQRMVDDSFDRLDAGPSAPW